jgi:GntR family transcriptional regulator / MocR family aminotransferase
MNTNHKFALDRIRKEYEKSNFEKIKYIKLHKAIKQCILNIELPNGWLLPSTRILADELKISRTSVLKAYELLSLEKLISSKTGSGNKIKYQPEEKKIPKKEEKNITTTFNYPEISEKGISYLKNTSLINRLDDDLIGFKPGLPPLDVFPINQWKRLLNSYWRHIKSSGLSYSKSTGQAELKKSICNYLNVSRNIKCTPNQIVITSGSLQSLYLIANTIINKEDTVVIENPVFPNVHSVFRSSQATLISANIDSEGINLDEIHSQELKNLKLIHVTPTNQYPLGIKMSLERKKGLLDWASNNSCLIIENDYENEIANYLEQIPSIYSLDNEDRTIYIGTFNRLLHPSIRLGYMIVPKYLMPAIEALHEHSHRFVSPSIQMVMNQFIEKNYLYQHLKNCIEVAKERHDVFKTAFGTHVKTMTIQEKPFSSFHLLAFFNSEKTIKEETEIIQLLNQHQITVYALSKCYVQSPQKTGLIFGFSAIRTSLIKRKLETMGDLFKGL